MKRTKDKVAANAKSKEIKFGDGYYKVLIAVQSDIQKVVFNNNYRFNYYEEQKRLEDLWRLDKFTQLCSDKISY